MNRLNGTAHRAGVRWSNSTIASLRSDLQRIAEDFSRQLVKTIANAPVSEIPEPPRARTRRRRRASH